MAHQTLRLAHENANDLITGFLSWTRNAVIATIAGASFHHVDPVSSLGLFGMGSVFLCSGTWQYWRQARSIHRHTPFNIASLALLATVPTSISVLWALSVWSFLRGTPTSLLEKVPQCLVPDKKLPITHKDNSPIVTRLQLEHKVVSKKLASYAQEQRSWIASLLPASYNHERKLLEQQLQIIETMIHSFEDDRSTSLE
eukprot:gene483-7866_t